MGVLNGLGKMQQAIAKRVFKGSGEHIEQAAEAAEEKVVKNKPEDKFNSWIENKYSKQYDSYMKMAQKGEEEATAAAKRFGMTEDEIEGKSHVDLVDEVQKRAQQNMSEHVMNPNIIDKMQYHKVPETVLGVGITAGLMRSLMNNNGQQSNAQLYNQDQNQQPQ